MHNEKFQKVIKSSFKSLPRVNTVTLKILEKTSVVKNNIYKLIFLKDKMKKMKQ